jgi:hypothetical protein
MIDLRKEFNQLVEEDGHYVLLQRASRKIYCLCWNEVRQESDIDLYFKNIKKQNPGLSTCPRCMGIGRVCRIERHKIRRDIASQLISLPQLEKQLPMGPLATETRVFWMKYDAHPRIGDIIMEVGWDGQKPSHLIKAYEITHVDGLRGKGGRIEYHQVTAKESNIYTDIRHFVVRRMGSVINYEMIRGR